MSRHTTPIPRSDLRRLSRALPFWMSLGLIPLAWVCALTGGWSIALLPLVTWFLFSLLDAVLGLNLDNADLEANDDDLYWYRLVTLIWVPAQLLTVFGLIWYVPQAEHLGLFERIALFFGVGVITGTIGINYSHELMHQKNRLERFLADVLLAMVLYSHFRSEHLLVHHRYVATPRDPVTARYNEGFHRFYPRVLRQCLHSAFKAEANMLARKNLPWHNRSNPFWKYWGLQIAFISLALILGGWSGLMLFFVQAGIAIWQLELVNYIEHYGLTRKHLGDGKYEHVKPHHSWNAAHKASNWLLINLQRHSDHHYKPDRRFPVLQNYGADEAPQLPFGYPVMTMAAMIPPLWRRVMNPRVRAWRRSYYPEISDWGDYNKQQTPMPR
ncbi:alkane 1-monooxygenase [Sulfitobacter sp. M57]|uniref:alkane 1-monooxygenase n=1 Tax=unclassified Sulfitobacter TaxID=196795 RepID=UPI0023E18F1A|nr:MULTISPECIES: alkane 1-monooxygenase [unclassified Sulfitobacter]MDF3415316.1 alkane 1-monooxygenase [Sulfitobacter sp. KE5]MDF3422797.1 alkane 1-monooxygenase [Sulfitobacter sp. KE43]MDF3433862.1 alkane 1-monooxygenase [Sulfitobacter sp. KE42]MDF3459502.1 alkane 1-monooxygenase [Sulfitobacter sp. S74]MDF3463401.1 alkane 1-monooxygenase [Sulfitobacter sp. Ks18]